MSTVSVINWWPRPSPVFHTDRPPKLTAPETITRSRDKASHTQYRALIPKLIPVYGQSAGSPQVTLSHPSGGRLPLLSARPAVTFPAAEHHHPFAGTKLYCLVTEEDRCKQLAQVVTQLLPEYLLIASPTLYPLRHRAPHMVSAFKI